MLWEQIKINLAHIDLHDDTYKITTEKTCEPLAASIEVAGLFNPPFLYSNNDRGYIVVSGFRRIAAFRQLNMDPIPARLIHSDTPAYQLALVAIAENAGQRELNLVEISRSLDLLKRIAPDREENSILAQSMGLPGNTVFVKKIIKICRLPMILQEGIISEIISLNTALELAVLDKKTVVILSELFADLRLSHNKQREILTYLKEIALREDIMPTAILKEPELHQTFNQTDLNRNQKVSLLRQYLKNRRYPQLTRAQQQFDDSVKKLALGQGVQMKPPTNFESMAYKLNLQFRNIAELKSRIEILQKVSTNPELIKMIGEI